MPPDTWRDTTVVIVGAGFSVPAGLPATNSIWKRAKELPTVLSQVRHLGGDDYSWMERHLLGTYPARLSDLLSALSRILVDELNLVQGPLEDTDVERVYQHLSDMLAPNAWTAGKFGPGDSALKYHAFRVLSLLLLEILSHRYEDSPVFGDEPPSWSFFSEDSLQEHDSSRNYGTTLPQVYRDFCNKLPPRTLIATTNYDDIAECSLLGSGRSWTYGYPIYYSDVVQQLGYHPDAGSFYSRWCPDAVRNPQRGLLSPSWLMEPIAAGGHNG